jgi:hypothetical protein
VHLVRAATKHAQRYRCVLRAGRFAKHLTVKRDDGVGSDDNCLRKPSGYSAGLELSSADRVPPWISIVDALFVYPRGYGPDFFSEEGDELAPSRRLRGENELCHRVPNKEKAGFIQPGPII